MEEPIDQGQPLSTEAFVDWFAESYAGDLDRLTARIELEALDHEVVIQGFMVAPPRRRGHGSAALRLLCAAADAHCVTLVVRPQPVRVLVAAPISLKALQDFYGRAGFVADAGQQLWRRKPVERFLPEKVHQ